MNYETSGNTESSGLPCSCSPTTTCSFHTAVDIDFRGDAKPVHIFTPDELAARDATQRAVAWDEGYARGVRDESGDIERADNPYRSED